ncbi:hypothetical protein M413DRAFT_12634 [Hebeloma cylindrosporum]|uniref:Uncharacterized protein n=1 Tax=Hebeloma cylindrosporum TaxID=76867 RepID=A0A0C2XLV6_HEBCY|nr:hypothetical protein M413DRAFT_12634 [Hebeloma cylindrosporum h7]
MLSLTSFSCFVLLILSALPLSQALVNTTIDDRDPRISYVPPSSWFLDEGVNADYGGAHMRTEDPNAYATVTLKFVSFYVLAAKWPYSVTTDIEIDGGIHVLVDMRDYDSDDVGSGLSTVPYSVVASWIGTTSGEHTLRISVPVGGEYAIVDGLMQVHVLSDPSSSSGSISTKGGNNASGSRVIVGVVCAVIAIALIFLLWWFCFRRRGRNNAMNELDPPYTGGAGTPPIDDYNQDGYDGYGSSPRMVESVAPSAYRPRNRAGGVQSLASSRQDGLASVAQSVVGGPPPRGFA